MISCHYQREIILSCKVVICHGYRVSMVPVIEMVNLSYNSTALGKKDNKGNNDQL